jgi:DNA-binding transcriptional LysR family regulator
MSKSLNLDHLRAFALVAERGSFSIAAERLRLSQPAVSLQVRQLERWFNSRLLDRIGRGVKPTAAGQALLAHLPQIEVAVDSALAAVHRHAAGTVGRVRIGTGETACIHLLPPALKELKRAYPDLDITVTTGNTAEVLKAIEEDRLDAGLVTMPAAGRAFHVTPLIKDEIVAIASPELRLPGRVTARSLTAFPVLLYEPAAHIGRLTDAWFSRGGVDLKPAMALGSVEAIKELVAAGLGCAVVPRMALGKEEGGRSVYIRSLTPRMYRSLALVLRRDKRQHKGLQVTLAAVKRLARTYAGELEREL